VAADLAARFGMAGLPEVPSLALGSGEVTMLSLVSAFGAFANDGVLAAPGLIRRVRTNDGKTLYERQVERREVVSAETAYLVTSMLEDVVDRGTAAQVRSLGFRRPAAGKTGTTNDYRDAWFVGYTRDLVAGVWVGYDQPRTIVRNGYAAQLAVPLWTRFMIGATRDHKSTPFRAPASIVGVEICPLTGKRATEACRHDPQTTTYVEHFAHGTEPLEFCPHHWHSGSPFTLAASASAPSISAGSAPVIVSPAASAEIVLPDDAGAEVEEAPEPKRRGFWSRLFGLGRGDREEEDRRRDRGEENRERDRNE